VWLWECNDSTTGSATMVMPSFSIWAPCKPHIGSDLGGGTFFAAIPESQCPPLPAQQGIEFALSSAAFAMRNGSAATKRHTKHKMPNERSLCFLCFFVAITSYQAFPNAPRIRAHRVHRGTTSKQCGGAESSCLRLATQAGRVFDRARRGRWVMLRYAVPGATLTELNPPSLLVVVAGFRAVQVHFLLVASVPKISSLP